MKTFSCFIGIFLAIMFCNVAGFAEDKVSIQYGHVAPPIHVQHIAATFFKNYLEKRSDGRIEVSVYPVGQLGGERVMAESVQNGTLHIGGITSAVLTNFVPEAALLNLPFFFPDKAAAQRLWESHVGQRIKEAFEKKGFKLLAFKSNGFRDFGNNVKPIHKPEDLRKMKFRSIESPLFIDAYQALGNKPVPIPFPEVHSSLQQGVIDGIDLHITGMAMAKIPVKYISVSGWILSAVLPVMNKDFFDGLPADIQAMIVEAAYEEKSVHLGTLATQELESRVALQERGVKINVLTPDERAAFAALMEPVYKKWREKIGPELYDEAVKVMNASK